MVLTTEKNLRLAGKHEKEQEQQMHWLLPQLL